MTSAINEPRSRQWNTLRPGFAIAWVICYFVYFFSFTLPNRRSVRRVDVWLELPELLWGNIVTPEGSSASCWANLAQRLDLLAVAGAIWLGSWAVGSLSLRAIRVSIPSRSAEHVLFSCGVGLSIVSLLMLGCGLLGWMSPFAMGGILLSATIVEFVLLMNDARAAGLRLNENAPLHSGIRPSRWASFLRACNGVLTRGEQIPYDVTCKFFAVIAMSLFLTAMLLGSMLPPTDFDVKAYHLTGPKEYFLDGRISFLEHNVYTSFPFLTEMHLLLGMVLRQDWYRGALAGQAVLMGFAPLTALGLFCAAGRWFGSNVGWLAATIYLTTPWTYRLAIIAYVEGALSCYLFLTLFAVLLAGEGEKKGDRSIFFLAGLCAGSAMACKYPGLVSVVVPMQIVCLLVGCWDNGLRLTANGLRPEMIWRRGIWFSVGVAITIGPWLLKNLIVTGNPVYPLAYGLFGGLDWDAVSHAKWRAGHSPNTFAISDLGTKFIDVTAKADWLSPLLFGLAPLAMMKPATSDAKLAPRPSPLTPLLSVYVVYLFLQWWLLTHRIDRFWVPMIPVVALLAAVGCEWSSSKPWRWASGAFIGLSVLFNLGFITSSLCGLNAYLADLDEVRKESESTAPVVQYINGLFDRGRIPQDGTVLCVGEAQVFDARPKVLYNVVFDQPILRDWMAERPTGDVPDSEWPLRPIAEIRRRFEQAGVTHVLVNWQELLRYRTTYGYSDFVTPERVVWLREQGLLGEPPGILQGREDYESLSRTVRDELDRWAPSLKRTVEGKPAYVTWQIFSVLK